MPDPRAAALAALLAVVRDGRSLATALPRAQAGLRSGPDRSLAQALVYGVLRWYPRLDRLAGSMLARSLPGRDQDIRLLLLLGLYQLGWMQVPPHAAIHETVQLAHRRGKGRLSGLVNALLRRYQRERATLERRLEADPVARWAHPAWLLERLQRDWPAQWPALCTAANTHPPMVLRVNRLRARRADCLARLRAAGIEARPLPGLPDALCLAEPVPVERLPGFAEGVLSVQDAGAQWAALLLDLRPGLRVLDACAAPGGKTGHIHELAPELAELVALDRDPQRLARVEENLRRLGARARLLAEDAAAVERWWDGRPFDRILLDAPCSATGVIRRHPDIKLLRRAGDIDRLADQQRRLLDALWPLLAPGGILLYATCSLLRQENEQQVTAFLARQPQARLRALSLPQGVAAGPGWQLLPAPAVDPATGGCNDGFFYAAIGRD